MRSITGAQAIVVASAIGTALAHGFHDLMPRGATNCGPSYGNAVCDPGQCCSSAGVCGTGTMCQAPDCLFQFGPACDANQTPPGVNTSSVSRPQFGNVPYGVTITKCNTPGKVALTFDDGPWIYTSDLLDLLKTNNIKATFFVVANNGGKGQIENDSTGWPALLRRMFNEGHQIASHTWSHQDLSTLNSQQIKDQIIKNEIAFEDIFGFIPTYLRPPYGRCYGDCLATLGNLGYHVITWNLDTNDWKEDYPTSQATFSSAIKNSNPSTDSFIPLTHDVHYGTVHGFAQYMIDNLKAAGYSTALVGECLNDPPANWYRDAKSGQQWSSSQTTTSTTSTSSSTSTSSTSAATSSSVLSSSSSSSSASSSTARSSSSLLTSSSTTHTSTYTSVHPTITIHPTFQPQGVNMSSQSTTSGCSNNMGACVLQGIGATDASRLPVSTTATSSPATTTAHSGAAKPVSHAITLVTVLVAILFSLVT